MRLRFANRTYGSTDYIHVVVSFSRREKGPKIGKDNHWGFCSKKRKYGVTLARNSV